MLESYFVRPQTVDRIRESWIGPEIERYVVWLAEQGYSSRSVLRRVPLLVEFAEFGRARGAQVVGDLPVHVDALWSSVSAGLGVLTRTSGSWRKSVVRWSRCCGWRSRVLWVAAGGPSGAVR